MLMDLVLLVQTTINALLRRRAATSSSTIVVSHPSVTARIKMLGAVRATLAILTLLHLTACAAPPMPPVAVAANVPTQTLAPTGEPTLAPVPADVPSLVSSPTNAPAVVSDLTDVPTSIPIPTDVPTSVPIPTDVPGPRYDMVLVGGTLIDATGAPPLKNAVVAIQDGRIVYVGTADSWHASANTPTIDVHGATIMPGFINSHVHISGRTENDLRRWTRAGVTTLRDLAGSLVNLTALRDRMRASNDPTFPRLLVAGPIVTVADGYPLVIKDQSLRVEGIAVRDSNDARATVSKLADGGADLIKIAVSGRTDVHWMELSAEEIVAITSTAHARGLRVTAHVDRASALYRAVWNGIDNAAHSPRDRIPDALIDLMVKRNVSMSPTISVYEDLARYKGSDAAWRQQTLPVMYDNVRRFVAAGGTLALGDDYGGVPNMPIGMPMDELLHWQAAGLSPQQIIEASTRGSALAIGQEAELGTVEVGKVADLLVVQGNPLTNLKALARPLLVVHNGEIVK